MISRQEIDDVIMTVCGELDKTRATLDNCQRLLRANLDRLACLDAENAGLRSRNAFLEQRQKAIGRVE